MDLFLLTKLHKNIGMITFIEVGLYGSLSNQISRLKVWIEAEKAI
jgi:hypothetical protein